MFRKSLLFNVFLTAAVVLLGYSAYKMVRDTLILRDESKEIERRIGELKKKKTELEAYLAELQSIEAIEREAKERFNLKKIGEKVIVVLPDKKEMVENIEEKSLNIWQRIKKFILGEDTQ
jgi:cell division protein FtsB